MNFPVWLVDQLSSPYFSAFFSGLITFIFMYIDSKITRTETHRRTYTKNVLLVAILTGTIVYVLTNTSLHPKISKIVEQSANAISGGGSLETGIHYDPSDILVGEPSF